jgi:undecaprenyl diphosphate synthase
MSRLDQIDKANVPKHVAIIMDGNGRWAREKGKERIYGHFNGVEAVRESLKASLKVGVEYLTLYAFSIENWNRPKNEVEALMDLLVKTIIHEIDELDENEVRLHAIGDLSNLPGNCHEELQKGIEKTRNNTRLNLILALSYSSRWEITKAVRKIAADNVDPEDITSDLIASNLETSGFPDPELMVRTSGEKRISNFLLWQLAYAELYFTETMWPDFREEDLYEAIYNYQGRERRFGKTSEQIIAR